MVFHFCRLILVLFFLLAIPYSCRQDSVLVKITDENGIFNLQIVNASLEDDAIFECQVGPSLNNRPIRASARVNVMRKYQPKKDSWAHFNIHSGWAPQDL